MSSKENRLTQNIEWIARLSMWLSAMYAVISMTVIIWLSFWRAVLPWMEQNPILSGWAQAIGGILAILATAIFGVVQSNHARNQLNIQIELQREALDHDIKQQELIRMVQRDSAIETMVAAYNVVRSVAEAAIRSKLLDKSFYETWGHDIEWAKRSIDNIDYSHMTSKSDMSHVSRSYLSCCDFDRSILNAIRLEEKNGSKDHFWRRSIKVQANFICDRILLISPGCISSGKLEISEEEEEANNHIAVL